jgi:hypothetical protein
VADSKKARAKRELVAAAAALPADTPAQAEPPPLEAEQPHRAVKAGQRFGRLVVIERNFTNPRNGAHWLCQCDCGKRVVTRGSRLRVGATRSCGCLKKEMGVIQSGPNLSGCRFGRLLVLGKSAKRAKGMSLWECLCDCGEHRSVGSVGLKKGYIRSCGCLRRELASGPHPNRRKADAVVRHPLYWIWMDMKQRCDNPHNSRFHRYGGCGITVCDRWRNDFRKFAEDMGQKPSPAHSIERINSEGNYEPANCRWATWEEQLSNRSLRPRKLTRILAQEMRGEIGLSRKQLAQKYGVSKRTVCSVLLNESWK